MRGLLMQQDLWKVVNGTERKPRPPTRPAEVTTSTTTVAQGLEPSTTDPDTRVITTIDTRTGTTTVIYPAPDLSTWDFEPEAKDDDSYMGKYDKFMTAWKGYETKHDRA